jgi:glycosyltransferase involved in cell wall biosynthesis
MMRILMLAPQPFFTPRGAPLCVSLYVGALLASGYTVDLVTYPYGEDIQHANLAIYRVPRLPFVQSVKPGLSLAKFPLDLFLFCTALWWLCMRRYSAIHTHEEAAFMGILLARIFACKHLYYMHCDLADMMPPIPLIKRGCQAVQTLMVRKAHAIIAFYPQIALMAGRLAPGKPVYLILPPVPGNSPMAVDEVRVLELRQRWHLGSGPVVLYTGTLEHYQGVHLLLHSVGAVRAAIPQVQYLIVGGQPRQIKRLQKLAQNLHITDVVCFTGQRPYSEMVRYMALATIMVSPRCQGTHTPLKLYAYMHSGKPVLATNILSHTQILTPETALLVPPTSEGLAQGALDLLQNAERAGQLAASAQSFSDECCSPFQFLQKSRQAYEAFAALPR